MPEHEPVQPVLLIDDDEDDWLLTRSLFGEIEGCPYTLEWAHSYRDGRRIALEQRHVAYLVDFHLGPDSGIELIRELRARGARRPMILLTGQADRQVDLEAMAAGAEDFLDKASLDSRMLERSVRYAVERHRAEERLLESDRARKQMAEAVAMRDEFILVAAHELRTPLTALRLFVEALDRDLEREGVKPGDLKAKSAKALRQIGRLGDLVEEVLDGSRITSGRFSVVRDQEDLSQIVGEVVDGFREQARAAGSELRADLDGPVSGWWDRLRISQVFTNLIANSLKYGAGRPVDIRLRAGNAEAEVTVRDRGIGISEVDQERIFGRFERAASLRHYGGLGLGLFIARHIVEAHGGRIEVESHAGEGSTFRILLPRWLETRPELSPAAS